MDSNPDINLSTIGIECEGKMIPDILSHSDLLELLQNIQNDAMMISNLCSGFTGADMKLLVKRAKDKLPIQYMGNNLKLPSYSPSLLLNEECILQTAEQQNINLLNENSANIKMKEMNHELLSNSLPLSLIQNNNNDKNNYKKCVKYNMRLKVDHFKAILAGDTQLQIQPMRPSVSESEIIEYENWSKYASHI